MDMTSGPPRRIYRVEVYTPQFLFTGELEPRGKLLDDLNSTDRGYVFMRSVAITPLTPNCILGPFSREEIIVDKKDIIAVYPEEEEARAEVGLLKHEERVIVYTAALILRATFHLGGEMRVRDMFDAMVYTFVPISQVSLFPLHTLKASIPAERKLLLLNKSQVIWYHPE